MSLGSQTVFNALQSHAQATGLFAKVNTVEPKAAPTGRAHMALYVAAIKAAGGLSGLNSSSAVLVIMGRIYLPFLQEPADAIDPEITAATDQIMEDLSADFELGGAAFAVDLLGMAGQPLEARAGYITVDQTPFRSMDITIPVIISNAFTQSP